MKDIYISSCDKDGGIYHYTMENGKLIFREKTELDRPMYTVYYKDRLYVLLKETDPETHFGGVQSFSLTRDGKLCEPSGIVSSGGIVPCHLAVTDDGVYIVNYLSGNVVSTGGKVSTHRGKGKNLPRQDMPHTHFISVSPDKKYLLCCDLGLDSIFTYDFNLNAVSTAKVPEGEGARHLAYSDCGKYVYCVNELGSTVSVFAYNDGALTLLNTYPAVENAAADNTAAAVRYRNGYVYVSNRGEDTIVCYRQEEDKLIFVSRTYVVGSCPRDFNFADDFLICTNEKTENIVVFKAQDGILTETGEITGIKDPLCVTVI